METMTNIFTEKEVSDRVALSLKNISKKFPVAYQLANIVEEIGLFTGKAYMDEQGCNFTPDIEGEWKCRLGFGLLTTSYVELTFNTRTGELNNIDFDKDKAPKFKNSEFWEGWLSNSTEERIKEIQSLL